MTDEHLQRLYDAAPDLPEPVLVALAGGHHKFTAETLGAGTSGLRGYAMNAMDVAVELVAADWIGPHDLAEALATFCSESLFYTEAFHQNLNADGSVDSTDWGPGQLNDKAHPEFFPGGDPMAIACNPHEWAKAAAKIAHVGRADYALAAWYGFKNRVFLDDYYLRRAALGLANYVARDLTVLAKQRPDVVAGRTTPETKTRTPMIRLAEFRTIYPAGT